MIKFWWNSLAPLLHTFTVLLHLTKWNSDYFVQTWFWPHVGVKGLNSALLLLPLLIFISWAREVGGGGGGGVAPNYQPLISIFLTSSQRYPCSLIVLTKTSSPPRFLPIDMKIFDFRWVNLGIHWANNFESAGE